MAKITLPTRGIICDFFFLEFGFLLHFYSCFAMFFLNKLLVTYVALPNSLILPS
jgi:hypothetical protein